MTPQEIYDTVAMALIAQGRPSAVDGDGRINCVYAAPDGARCAVGHLMNDEEINAYGNFEGDISALLKCDEWRGGRMRPLFHDEGYFLKDLQHDHDTYVGLTDEWLDRWKQAMRDTARRYDLNDAVLNESGPVMAAETNEAVS